MSHRGFMFWSLAPLLVVFIVYMPFLVQKRDPTALFTLALLEVAALLLLIGLYDTKRYLGALRWLGLLVFAAYAIYAAQEWWHLRGRQPGPPNENNLVDALLGLRIYGLPGLLFFLGASASKWIRLRLAHSPNAALENSNLGESGNAPGMRPSEQTPSA